MTDTDKELLELAAKAAGYNMAEVSDGYPMYIEGYGLWNPLEDDGDALRLAVKLRLEVCVWDTDTTVLTSDDDILTLSEPANGDPLAATRRAIVRAAAEIGRSMK
jgi:hypothetical protein